MHEMCVPETRIRSTTHTLPPVMTYTRSGAQLALIGYSVIYMLTLYKKYPNTKFSQKD